MIRPAGGLYRRMKPPKPRPAERQPLPLAADLSLTPEEFVRLNYPPPSIDLSGAQLPAVVTNGLSQPELGTATRAEFERYALADLLPDLQFVQAILLAGRGSPFDMWTGGDFLTKLGAKTLYRPSYGSGEQLLVRFPNNWGASIVKSRLTNSIEVMAITFPEDVIEVFEPTNECWSRVSTDKLLELLTVFAGRQMFNSESLVIDVQTVDVSDPATSDSLRNSNAIARRLLGSPDQENNSP